MFIKEKRTNDETTMSIQNEQCDDTNKTIRMCMYFIR